MKKTPLPRFTRTIPLAALPAHSADFRNRSTMKRILIGLLPFAAISLQAGSDSPVQPVPFTDVHITGGVLQSRQATNTAVTAPFALTQCESSGRMKNFDLA